MEWTGIVLSVEELNVVVLRCLGYLGQRAAVAGHLCIVIISTLAQEEQDEVLNILNTQIKGVCVSPVCCDDARWVTEAVGDWPPVNGAINTIRSIKALVDPMYLLTR